MRKHPITFNNLDGEPITRDFYFNLSVPEFAELEYSLKGGVSAYWVDIVERKDSGAVLAAFKDLVGRAFGIRDEDGVTFNKSPEISRKFMQSDAYTKLFMQFFGPDASNDAFVNWLRGIVPPELAEKMPTTLPVQEGNPQALTNRTKAEEYTREELLAMDNAEFDRVAGTDPMTMSREVLMVAMQRRQTSNG